jgi:hypothetical protein
MVAQKRFDGILFWTFIVQAVAARAYLRMNISLRESMQTYFHDAEFLADSLLLDLKPIPPICGLSETGGGNNDSCRIPRLPGFNALQRQFRCLEIVCTCQTPVDTMAALPLYRKANKRRIKRK